MIPLTETVFFKNLDQFPEKQALFFRAPQASEGKREADVGGRGTRDTRGLLVTRRGNLGPNKEFQDGGQQWFFYRVSSISKPKVCSHCLFELQSSIVLFSM